MDASRPLSTAAASNTKAFARWFYGDLDIAALTMIDGGLSPDVVEFWCNEKDRAHHLNENWRACVDEEVGSVSVFFHQATWASIERRSTGHVSCDVV